MLIKIGNRYINMAMVTDVVFWVREGYVKEAHITLLATEVEWTGEDTGATKAQVLKLVDREAAAVKWWCDTHSFDAMAAYENVLEEVRQR